MMSVKEISVSSKKKPAKAHYIKAAKEELFNTGYVTISALGAATAKALTVAEVIKQEGTCTIEDLKTGLVGRPTAYGRRSHKIRVEILLRLAPGAKPLPPGRASPHRPPGAEGDPYDNLEEEDSGGSDASSDEESGPDYHQYQRRSFGGTGGGASSGGSGGGGGQGSYPAPPPPQAYYGGRAQPQGQGPGPMQPLAAHPMQGHAPPQPHMYYYAGYMGQPAAVLPGGPGGYMQPPQQQQQAGQAGQAGHGPGPGYMSYHPPQYAPIPVHQLASHMEAAHVYGGRPGYSAGPGQAQGQAAVGQGMAMGMGQAQLQGQGQAQAQLQPGSQSRSVNAGSGGPGMGRGGRGRGGGGGGGGGSGSSSSSLGRRRDGN